MSLKSGRVTSMTSKEICAILEASKGTGIKKLKIKDLVLEFDNLTNYTSDHNNSNIAIPNTSNDIYVEDVKYLEDEEPESNKEVVDEFVMANLMVNDPEAFEKRQREL